MGDRFKTIYNKYKKILSGCDSLKLEANDDLIQNIAFTVIILERLRDEIDKTDITENFVQGKQRFTRESPAVKSYNATLKSFATLSKQLNDLLPDKKEKLPEGEALLSFLASDKK